MTVGPVTSFLRELHLPDPLVNPLMGNKGVGMFSAFHRNQFRRVTPVLQLRTDKIFHGLVKDGALCFTAVPLFTTAVCGGPGVAPGGFVSLHFPANGRWRTL